MYVYWLLGPVYTERHSQRCDNTTAPDKFGIATHIWTDLLGVSRKSFSN